MTIRAGRKEWGSGAANLAIVRPAKQTQPVAYRRPPEPIRPLPARRIGVSLLAVRARRRRYRGLLPPRSGETGGW
jgi:hypothetical protein